MLKQFVNRHRLARSQCMPERADELQFVVPNHLGRQAFVVDRAFDNADVNLVVFDHVNHPGGVGDAQAHRDRRELRLKRPDNAGNKIRANRGAGGHRQRPGNIADHRAHFISHPPITRHNYVGVRFHQLAGRGQHDAVVRAVEQPRVELFLELPNLKGDRRLRHVQ